MEDFISHSQWPNPSPSNPNPIFPGKKWVNPSSHFTPSGPSYNELYPTDTRIGILYVLPKIHKSSIPFRPILSCINHYSYKIARFFTPFLTPISMSSFVIKDSFSFVQERLNADVNTNNVFMAQGRI